MFKSLLQLCISIIVIILLTLYIILPAVDQTVTNQETQTRVYLEQSKQGYIERLK